MRFSVVLVICASLFVVFCEKVRFDNYRIYLVHIENAEQLDVIQKLEAHPDGLVFLETPTAVGGIAEILVPPHKFADIKELFDMFKLKNEIRTKNVQRLIDEEQPKSPSRATFGWQAYYDLPGIYHWLDELLRQHPNELSNYNIGYSYEGRPIRAVRFSRKPTNPTIFIESTIHAREWITAATATYILNELLTSNDPQIKELADNYDWVIIPVLNVDGYTYTHTTNRMWRKSRTPNFNNYNPYCVGVDQNRNFDVHHAEQGASRNPCSETYAGPYPFSEPETRALANFVRQFSDIKIYMSFHSYGQMLLFPYGFTNIRAKNFNDMNAVGLEVKKAMQRRYGTQYIVGSISEAIYLASGSSIDWAYANQNVSMAYSFEFRDSRTGQYGFILPARDIIPNALEAMDGLIAMVTTAKSLKYL